jgi:hypothetical protein
VITKRLWGAVAAVLCIVGFSAAPFEPAELQPAAAQEPKAPETAALAPALRLVPADAAGFLHVRVADLWQSEAVSDLRSILAKAGPLALRAFEEKYVPAPSQIESVTLIFLTAESVGEPIFDGLRDRVSPVLVVTTTKPFDRAQLAKAFGPDAKPARHEGQNYFRVAAGRSAFHFVDERTFVAASVKGLRRWLERQAGDGQRGPLHEALREANGKHTGALGFNPARLPKEPFGPFAPPPRSFSEVADAIGGNPAASSAKAANPLWGSVVQPLLKARSLTLSIDVDSKLRGTARLDFSNEDDAANGATAVRAGVQAARDAIAAAVADVQRDLRDGPKLFALPGEPTAKKAAGPKALFREGDQAIGDIAKLVQIGVLHSMDEQLRAVTVERHGRSVHVAGGAPLNGSSLVIALTAISAFGRSANATFEKVGDSIAPPPAPPADAKASPDFTPVLPAGKRAVAIRARLDGPGRAAVLPQSHVCLIWSSAQGKGEVQSRVLLEDALVIAVDVPAEEQKLAAITLALSPEDAARVASAQETGSLSVALQPPSEPKR